MAVWHLRHGSWWMVQWCFAGWFSLGVHVDPRLGRSVAGIPFGPYVDFYLGPFTLSVGRRPYLTHPEMQSATMSRGGMKSE